MHSTIIDHHANLPDTYLPSADQVEVHLDDTRLRVVRYARFDAPLYVAHAGLPDDRERTLRIDIKRKQISTSLWSSRGGLNLRSGGPRGRSLLTEISGQPYLCLECDGIGYLAIICDPITPDPSGATVLTSTTAGIEPHPSLAQTEAVQSAIDQVAESDDLDTLLVSAGHYRIGDIQLRSGVRLHLASGAVLQASDNAADIGDPTIGGWDRQRACLIEAHAADNISITGPGHIDGNRAVLDLQRYFKGMVRLTGCTNVTIDGPTFADACGWNTTPRHCTNVQVKRLKIHSNRPMIDCINTDGCNPDGCQNVLIEHCFFHTGDDAVAVKSTNYDGEAQDCCDISVRDLLAVNNSTTAKVGTETMAGTMARISFEYVCAVRTRRLVGLDAYDYAAISDVTWRNCHVHSLDGQWVEPFVIDIQAPAARTAFRSVPAQATVKRISVDLISSDVTAGARTLTRLDDGQPVITNVNAGTITIAGEQVPLSEETSEVPSEPATRQT